MSRFTALLLAGIICCQAFYNVGVLSYWAVNRTYIAANLCENVKRPEMHCNGKCYLKKKLAADAGATNGLQLPTLKRGLDLAECPARIISPDLIPVRLETPSDLPSGDSYCTTGFPYAVFHPPAPCA